MARGGQTEFKPKGAWFADIGEVMERRGSAQWFMRTDSGKSINIHIVKGELVHLQCGFRDIRGTMGVLSRCDMVAFRREPISSSGAKTLMERGEVLEWLDKARRSAEIENLPSERLAFGAGRMQAGEGETAQTAHTRSPKAAPAPSRPTAAARANRSERREVPWVRRTLIVAGGLAALTVGAGLLLDTGAAQARKVWTTLWGETASGQILEDTSWSGWVTAEGEIQVEGGAVLTIAAGTRVEAAPGAGITVGRDARLIALGTRAKPIVFTARGEGGIRESGDWKGIRVFGNAPVDASEETLRRERAKGEHNGYGGNDTHDECARLRFVRIEFAGAPDGAGLALHGCGTRTWLEHVQVHRAQGRALALVGGSAHVRKIMVSQAAGLGVEATRGWSGTWQNVIVQMDARRGGTPVRIGSDDERAPPDSAAQVWNTTIVGAKTDGTSPAMILGGTQPAQVRNTLIAGGGGPVVELAGERARVLLETGATQIRRAVVSGAGEPAGATVSARTIRAWMRDAKNGVVRTSVQILGPQAWYEEGPEFTPRHDTAASQGEAPGEGFDANRYCGAVRPGAQASWTWGWTSFPMR